MRRFLYFGFLTFCFALLVTFPVRAGDTVPETFTTESGISGLLLEDHHLPMVTLQFIFPHAGGSSDPQGKEGRAYFGTEMVMEGAGSYDAAEFRERLESLAIHLNTSVNEDYFAVTVKTLSQNLESAMELAGLLLTRPRFDPAAFDRVHQQLLTQLAQMQEDPGWLAEQEWNRTAYGDHAYGTALQGTTESLAAIRRQDLETWQMQAFSRENIIVAAVGDVTRDTLIDLLQKNLEDLPEKLRVPKTEAAPAIPLQRNPIIIEKDVPQTVALFGMPSLPRNHPDFYIAYVMNHVLGGGSLTSRLSNAIRQQYGLAYSAGSYLSSGLFGAALTGNFATRNEQAVQATEVMQHVLHQLASEGANDEEVENAKQYIMGSFPLSLDSQQARVNYLTSMQLYQLGNDYLQKRNDYFRAVTTQDVNRVAKDMLTAQPLLVMIGKPQGTVDWESYALPPID